MDNQEKEPWWKENKLALSILGVFLILALVVVLIFSILNIIGRAKSKPAQPAITPVATSAPTGSEGQGSSLPSAPLATSSPSASGSTAVALAAEKIKFSDYYNPAVSPFNFNFPKYQLPLNIKTDAANYYDINRQINLDAGLDQLNINGFAVLTNPFAGQADNFYELYQTLGGKGVPALVTSDFLIYYWQNILKQSYKDIESSIFYENLWEINARLYQVARQRYENNLAQKSATSDAALESSRLELAYFAVALNLLAPTPAQINQSSSLNKNTGFTSAEAEKFSAPLPSYLSDVAAETQLIRAAKGNAKSPVLLYQRNYQDFAIPAAYQRNARLANFYLASRWLNSVFPLYFKDASCPNCLLDRDDWRINILAAFRLTDDLSADQDLQNRWAKIYKLQSFFSGLRDDLNYLNYRAAEDKIFGSQSGVEKILGQTDEETDKNLLRLRDELAAVEFSPLAGGLDKTATATKPLLGMKMLAEPFDPTVYIFHQLTYPLTGALNGDKAVAQKTPTACVVKNTSGYNRCFGSGWDVINLIHPLAGLAIDDFTANGNYERYGSQVNSLRLQLADFTTATRHNSDYWLNLDIANKLLTAPEKTEIKFMNDNAWLEKDLSTMAAAWANQALSADTFAPPTESGVARLNSSSFVSARGNQYIEPNLTLVRELLADTEMINQALVALGASDGGNTVLEDLDLVRKNLTRVNTIIEKELGGTTLSEEDYSSISALVNEFSVKTTAAKTWQLASPDAGLKENLAGVKLLVLAAPENDKKILVVGPIFNYQEGR
ncbi:MAG TPA: DUF3160 domain-containing protein [Candidatus Methylomirabilis sp.]|nr:DUF3160 domain-containing protein [Candidatus Methylomirabilis sp.]